MTTVAGSASALHYYDRALLISLIPTRLQSAIFGGGRASGRARGTTACHETYSQPPPVADRLGGAQPLVLELSVS